MRDQILSKWMRVTALLLCCGAPAARGADQDGSPKPAASGAETDLTRSIDTLPPALPARSSQRDSKPGATSGEPRSSLRSPLAITPSLNPAPFAAEDRRFPITLATALRLSDARPLVVAAAQARVWIAEAELTRAKVLWLPDLNIGFDYIRHDGGGPDFNKGIMTAPSTNFFYGGAGLWGNDLGIIHTTDAIYQPLMARQVLNARHWDTQGAKNDALMQTADAYFLVHQYRGIYGSALYTVGLAGQLVKEIQELGRDLVPAYEVDRARNMVADLQQQAVSARQQWRVQSARLTRVLRLDPRAVVEPLEHDHTQITLLDPGRGLDDLTAVALTNRPEIASRRALVEAATIGISQEKARPFIPVVAITGFQTPFEMLQAGIFAIGPNSSLNQWAGRDDFSVQPLLQFQNLGMGNLAQIKIQRGMQSEAMVNLYDAQDRVAEEVTQAQARLQSAAVRVYQAERALRTGIITYNGTLEGLKQTSRFGGDMLVLISRPQEAVYALQMLQRAFNEYFTTVAEYNRSQFGLFHALGYPARELAEIRSPGAPRPVDTSRPSYLPPVGNGPPPATR